MCGAPSSDWSQRWGQVRPRRPCESPGSVSRARTDNTHPDTDGHRLSEGLFGMPWINTRHRVCACACVCLNLKTDSTAETLCLQLVPPNESFYSFLSHSYETYCEVSNCGGSNVNVGVLVPLNTFLLGMVFWYCTMIPLNFAGTEGLFPMNWFSFTRLFLFRPSFIFFF